MTSARYGDIIYIKHKLYKHYAIYINDNCVIHYDGKLYDFFLKKMCIKETNMDKFLFKNKRYYIYNVNTEDEYSPGQTVQRARSRIGEKNFNIFFNNSMHFATWCKIGERKSSNMDI